MATVCQRWRTVSLDAISALWSEIPHLRDVKTYEPLLARARDFPIALTYSPEYLDDMYSFCSMLSRSIGRISRLRLVLPEPDDDEESRDAAEYLHDVLCRSAPILDSLVISDPGDMFCRVYHSLPILKSPMLRTIELKGFHLSCLEACADSTTLRNLSIMTPEGFEQLLPEEWALLSRLPVLESLSLHLLDVAFADLPAHSPRLPQSIQHLCLKVHSELFDSLVRLEDLARFQTLHVVFLYWQTEDVGRLASLLPFLRTVTISASVHFGDMHLCLLAGDGSGRRRVFRNIILDDDWHTLVPNVTRLWLDAYHPTSPHDPGTKVALFPALEELTLDATPPASGSARPPVWPALSCPRLRTVRVISETERPPVPSITVWGYLRRILDSSTRVESLVFDGVTLGPTPGIGVDLATLADNVTTVQSGEVPSESYRVWANAW